MNYLKTLENESIDIIRNTFAQAENPVMLTSLGKDSSVLLHLAKKAFYPVDLPFPLMHIDTGWNVCYLLAWNKGPKQRKQVSK